MKAITTVVGLLVTMLLGAAPTAVAAWMAWPAFSSRGRLVLAGLCGIAAMTAVFCRWRGRRAEDTSVICDQLSAMSSGEEPLTQNFDESREDELSMILNDYLDRVCTVIEDIHARAREIESGTLEMQADSQRAVCAAEAQVESLDTVRAALEEMGTFLAQNRNGVESANELTQNIESAAKAATLAVQETLATREKNGDPITDSQRVLATAADIAFQADLVALNAEVEAARAGSAGVGFAVVARALRELALRLGDNRRETAALIKALATIAEQSGRTGTVVHEALRGVLAGNRKATELIARLAASHDGQSAGMQRLSEGIGAIRDVTHGSYEGARHLAETSQTTVLQLGELALLVAADTADDDGDLD